LTKGELLKFNATTYSKSTCNKMSASAITDGKVQHADATTWFDNYPMETLQEQYFDVVWTHAYNGSGVKLDQATWGDHPRSGDTIDFKGAWGFDRTAMRNFVANGKVQWIQLEVKFIDPSHAGNPDVWFAPHTYTSKPASWNEGNVNTTYQEKQTFNQTGADYVRHIFFDSGAWLNGNLAGFRADGMAEPSDSVRFAGKTTSHGVNAFVSRILIQVLK
jgi:hypothetical protein